MLVPSLKSADEGYSLKGTTESTRRKVQAALSSAAGNVPRVSVVFCVCISPERAWVGKKCQK